jgi:hypothetical protein
MTFGGNIWATLDRVRDRVSDMVLIHGGDTKGADRIASSWAERRSVPQVTFSLDMKLGAHAGVQAQRADAKPRSALRRRVPRERRA